MSAGSDTLVASSKGDIITYEEHCLRLDAYLEEIKAQAMTLTAGNKSLPLYIKSLRLVHGNLNVNSSGCKFFMALQSRASKIAVPLDGATNCSVVLDDRGYPALYWAFLGLRGRVLESIMGDYFLPRLARNRTALYDFIKRLMTEDLHWTFHRSQKQDACLEIVFERREPDFFWIALPHSVRVLIGTYGELQGVLSMHVAEYAGAEMFLVDIGLSDRKSEDDYHALTQGSSNQSIHVWNINGIATLFTQAFRELAKEIAPFLQLSVRETFLLGEALSDTEDTQDQLIRDLRALATGQNIPHENLLKQILRYCFEDEFIPFHLKEQVEAIGGQRRRDFIIYNSNPKGDFWRHLRSKGVEQILVDAKNYEGKLTYESIANTLEYLINPAFGHFIIIITRVGIADYGRLLDAYLASGGKQIVVVLTDDDLIQMIHLKKEGKSATTTIEERYQAFLHMK